MRNLLQSQGSDSVPQSQVVSPVSVHHILKMIGRMEKLAVLPLTGPFLHFVVAGDHSVADRTR